MSTTPIVVCNACVSGLSAQLLADHLLSADLYDYAIVVGAEVQSKFIVSGFQSLKAVSDEPCRPFDIERIGLNPGEAAATIIFKTPSDSFSMGRNKESLALKGEVGRGSSWCLLDGATCNDAYHNVSPSPQGEGLTKAINAVMKGRDKSQLATICAHGTATLYNDQMESVAIQRTGLSDIPLSALKGYFGHTMGAAGVLETILTMRATDDGIILPSKGFTELGVSKEVSISSELQKTDKRAFLKIMSGFGGCNVAALWTLSNSPLKGEKQSSTATGEVNSLPLREGWRGSVRLSSKDGKSLTDIYKQEIGNYPKFYKMDILSRLAFVASELLKKSLPLTGELEGVFLFNHSSSIVADRQFLDTIKDAENFFPAPPSSHTLCQTLRRARLLSAITSKARPPSTFFQRKTKP